MSLNPITPNPHGCPHPYTPNCKPTNQWIRSVKKLVHENPLHLALATFIFRTLTTSRVLSTASKLPINQSVNLAVLTIFYNIYCAWKPLGGFFLKIPYDALGGIGFPKSEMSKRLYSEGVCKVNGEVIGKLRYKLNHGRWIPVLETRTRTFRDRGFAHGFLLGSKIYHLYYHTLLPMIKLLQIEAGDFKGKGIEERAKSLRFPPGLLEEMEGMLEGFNEYAKQHHYPQKFNLDTIKQVHVMLDTYKSILFSFACNMIAVRMGDDMVTLRALDWLSCGSLGEHKILADHHDLNTGHRIESFTFPSFLGILTGSNGLVDISINEVGSEGKKRGVSLETGTPYTAFTWELLHEKGSIQEVSEEIERRRSDLERLPASAVQIIVSDKKGQLRNFQFHVEAGELYTTRSFGEDGLFVATNHAEKQSGEVIKGSSSAASSLKRKELLLSSLRKGVPKEGKRSRDKVKAAMIKAEQQQAVKKTTIGVVLRGGRGEEPQYRFDNHDASDLLDNDEPQAKL